MNILVGLGNPGDRYQHTRHNAGFLVLDNLSEALGCSSFSYNKKLFAEVCKADDFILVKPQTFMNDSGKAVQAVLSFYKLNNQRETGYQNLFVIHDDLDLELGSYKIKFGVGPKAHNGLLSIYQSLGSYNFWHVRIGVDTRKGERSIPSKAYVLDWFNQAEQEVFNEVKQQVVKELVQKLS